MHALVRSFVFVLAAALLPAAASAQARSFAIAGGSRIQFVSDAPLERITGTSTTVSGSVSVDPSDLSTASGSVRVPITSIGTGDALRDEHLHGDGWLDAAAHPDAVFEITRVEGATSLAPNEVVNVTLHGRFTIHGATHEISARAQVRYLPAEGDSPALLRAQARFSLACGICKRKHGACIQCAGSHRCFAAYHPLCARMAGYSMKIHCGSRSITVSPVSLTSEPAQRLPPNMARLCSSRMMGRRASDANVQAFA